eukprot:TRINITY_DN73165_c0_g1_i1.p2 TRINITY_DN73165_c0_g1~~TRINITY_DN73165_c0_g1_i1.p2  ORF type:complete len:102 (+),score=43.23 TRINITY_DN73165_c0_g1_i1:63-368(+)
MGAFRLAVYQEFASKDLLAKLPDFVVADVAAQPWSIAEEKRSDEAKLLLTNNAKLMFDPATETAEVEKAVAALTGLGFKEVERFPTTSTGHQMKDRIVFSL